MKKTSSTILFLLTFLLASGQSKRYSDIFDFNLKGNPKSIKEISSFRFDDYLNPEYSSLFEKGINSLFSIDEYHFDSLGMLNKKYKREILDTSGYWVDYSSRRMSQYNDTIIILDYFESGSLNWKEKKILNDKGFLKKKIVEFPVVDTVIYKRDDANRIIECYSHSIGIDSQVIKIKNIQYNEKDCIKKEEEYIKCFGAMYDEPSIRTHTTDYQYSYDLNGNWIVRSTIQNNEITILTQRIICY